jgi:conjugal transfer ATP-binding protein TraC
MRRAAPAWWERLTGALAPRSNLRGVSIELPRSGLKPTVDRLSGALTVVAYAPAERLFLLNAGGESPIRAVGRVYEMNCALGADEALSLAIERFVRSELPERSVIGVTRYASPAIRPYLRDVLAARRGETLLSPSASDLARTMIEERARMFDRIALTGVHRGEPFAARNFRIWISVTTEIGDTDDARTIPGLPAVKNFSESADAALSALDSFGLLAHAWRAEDYAATMSELLNMEHVLAGDEPGGALDPRRELRDQTVRHDTAYDVERDRIRITSPGRPAVEMVALEVTGYPDFIHVNDLASLMGSDAVSGASLPHPFLFTTLIEPTAVSRDKSVTAVKLARVKQLRSTEIGVYLTDLAEREHDLTIASRACESEGGLARVAHELVLWAPPGRGVQAAESAKAILAEARFEGALDLGLQFLGLMMSLPLEGSWGLMRDLSSARHTSTKTRRAAAHMMPILGEYRGTGRRSGAVHATPMALLTSRRGQLFGVDTFANRNGNYNGIVVGTSGSGKSVLTQEIVMSMLSTGSRVWVFDIGRSYQHLMELMNGQGIDFGAGTELCVNPLDIVDDPQDMIEEIAHIITTMANGETPLDLTQAELLKIAILRVSREARAEGRVPTITDLTIELMGGDEPGLRDLATRLMPYSASGRYARWFEGRANVDFSAALVVLEMESLVNKPLLQSVILLILIMRIFEDIRRLPRSARKLIVIDEAWRLLSGESGRFIEWACRTLRKYGAGIICITQSMEDFEASGTARAVRMNADSVFLLRQKEASILAATADEHVRGRLRSLTTQADLWSEVYCRIGDGAGVIGRLVLDDFSMTAYSTRSEVFEAVEAGKKQGLGIVDAIAAVAGRQS